MKVALVACNASYVHTNLAVRCIARALTRRGHEAVIVERSLKDRRREFLTALYEADADVYGFSVYIWNRETILSLAADLHQIRPDAKIVFGGPEISYEDPSFFERHPFVDNIIAGEGEDAFGEYCDNPPPRHTILCGTPYAGFAEAGILYDLYPPHTKTGGILYYESSRGCPFRCSYCLSSATRGVRAKSAEQTIAELAQFESMDGVAVIKFVDRTFNFDRRRADAIWQALAGDNFRKTYHFEVCADLLDEENFRTLAAMPKGRIQLECGVQSTNPDTLRAIDRHADPRAILAALDRIRRVGNIHIHADLIAGLPHEGLARFARSFDETFPVCDLLQLGFLKLLPGTSLRKQCAGMGYRYSPAPPYEVLISDCLSYEDLCRLHRIDEVLDRFAGGGNFPRTLTFLLAREDSPFAFFAALADAIPAVRALSQRDAFSAFRRFAHGRVAAEDAGALDDCLILDWLTHEAGSLPDKLEPPRDPREGQLRREYCAAHREAHPSTVQVICLSDGTPILIDRQNHRTEIQL